MKRQYQNVCTGFNAPESTLDIYNENFFRPLDYVSLNWTLLHDGKPVRQGIVTDLDVAPQATAKKKINLGDTSAPGYWHLNVAYNLNEADGLCQPDTPWLHSSSNSRKATTASAPPPSRHPKCRHLTDLPW